MRRRGHLSAAMTTPLSHFAQLLRPRLLALPGRGTHCVIVQRTKRALWSGPTKRSPREGLGLGWAVHVRSRRAEDTSPPCPAAITCDPTASFAPTPAEAPLPSPCWGPESAQGPCGDKGGRGPSQPVSHCSPPGQTPSQKALIDRREPELSARSDTISFPLRGSISSLASNFCFQKFISQTP